MLEDKDYNVTCQVRSLENLACASWRKSKEPLWHIFAMGFFLDKSALCTFGKFTISKKNNLTLELRHLKKNNLTVEFDQKN